MEDGLEGSGGRAVVSLREDHFSPLVRAAKSSEGGCKDKAEETKAQCFPLQLEYSHIDNVTYI